MPTHPRVLRRALIAGWGEPVRPLVRALDAAGIESVVLLDEPSADHLHIEEAPWAAPVVGLRASPLPATVDAAEARRIVEAAMDAGADAILPSPGRYAGAAELAQLTTLCGMAWAGARADTLARLPLERAPAPHHDRPTADWIVVVLLADGEGGALPLGVQRRVRPGGDASAGWIELGTEPLGRCVELARAWVRDARPWGMIGVHFDAGEVGDPRIREIEPGLVGGWRLHDRALGVSMASAVLELASGAALGWDEAELGVRGVGLQATVVALEAGVLEDLEGEGQTTLVPGCPVDPALDPVLLRLIVHADSYAAALTALAAQADSVTVSGVHTNLDALRMSIRAALAAPGAPPSPTALA